MNHKQFELNIEKYLTGSLHKKEKEAFEEHYFSCDSCFYQLKLHEYLNDKKVSIVLKSRKKSFLSPIFKPSFAIFSIVILFFSTYLFIGYRNEQKKIDSISSFSPPLFISSEKRDNNYNIRFENAMNHYNRSDFSGALKIIMKTDAEIPKILFFKGVLHLLNNDPEDSIAYFDKILEKMDPSYFDESILYKGIALLKLNKKNESVKELGRLANMYSPLRDKAINLIEKIKKL